MENDTLRTLVDLRDRVIQKNRMAFEARLQAIERGSDTSEPKQVELLQGWYEKFLAMEKEVDSQIKEEIDNYLIIEYVIEIKGVGPMLAAKLVSMIDIHQCNTVSALWRYCGQAVIDGKAERRVAGEKLHYNHTLKSTLYVLAGSFLKSNSPYRQIYDKAKETYMSQRQDWTKSHVHLASMRKMIKVFLQHLWITWRTIEGLPTRGLYVHEYMDHTTYIEPQELGWRVVNGK